MHAQTKKWMRLRFFERTKTEKEQKTERLFARAKPKSGSTYVYTKRRKSMERKSGYCCDQERNAIILLKLKDGKKQQGRTKKRIWVILSHRVTVDCV